MSSPTMSGASLAGVRVLDFSTLLPGPLATLMLAEAGAEVIKIERPGRGDEMRSYVPKHGQSSVNFALLNRGKRSVAIDLKDPAERERLMPLVKSADVIVEQFRPGVMDRLGLGWDAVKAINPKLVYCSLTGYGQTGPRAHVAGHDLNYMAETGILALGADATGKPPLPPVLAADIGGGTLPAVINILFALRKAEQTGEGSHLDVAMCDNLFTWAYWALGDYSVEGAVPRPGGELVTGGSPRYRVYPAADGRFVAAAPIEDKFWARFCDIIDLPEAARDDSTDPEATATAVAERIASQPASHWAKAFEGEDVCCSIVHDLSEALDDPHFRARGVFARNQGADGTSDARIPALPLPLASSLAAGRDSDGYPALGEANDELLGRKG